MNKSNKLRMASGAIVALLCAGSPAQSSETVVVGPLEAFSPKGTSITVLGQSFVLGGRQSRIYKSLSSAEAAVLGTYVLARGEKSSDGKLVAKSVEFLSGSYVPGATLVFIRGSVDSYDAALGIIQVGGLKFFVSQAFVSGSISIAVSDEVEIVGTQAIPAGPVWASAVESVSASIDAISADAIVGTGAQVQAIVGTGASTQAIVGTGTSTQAIVGTGKQQQAIVGTGKQAQAIVGTGASTQAIVGTGASTQAIVGTGKQSQAIVGTGKQAEAIVGTGASTQAIVGTGASTQAIVGTGKQALAIVGTGKQTEAIVGTGADTQAIVGTGNQTRAIVGTGY